jgi:hypothetical protein
VNPRLVAALAAALFAFRVLSSRVTMLPGVAVPVVIPLGVAVLAVIALGVWLIRRHARFRSCPHPHTAFRDPPPVRHHPRPACRHPRPVWS